MKEILRKTLLAIALLTVFALGGAAVAGAVQGGSNSAATTTTEDRPAPRQRSDETPLTGETAEKVRAAALAEVPGATVERLETDGDGNAAYEAHLVKADGTHVTVYVNREFEVVATEEGRGRGPGGRGDCGPPPDDDSADSGESDGTSA